MREKPGFARALFGIIVIVVAVICLLLAAFFVLAISMP